MQRTSCSGQLNSLQVLLLAQTLLLREAVVSSINVLLDCQGKKTFSQIASSYWSLSRCGSCRLAPLWWSAQSSLS